MPEVSIKSLFPKPEDGVLKEEDRFFIATAEDPQALERVREKCRDKCVSYLATLQARLPADEYAQVMGKILDTFLVLDQHLKPENYPELQGLPKELEGDGFWKELFGIPPEFVMWNISAVSGPLSDHIGYHILLGGELPNLIPQSEIVERLQKHLEDREDLDWLMSALAKLMPVVRTEVDSLEPQDQPHYISASTITPTAYLLVRYINENYQSILPHLWMQKSLDAYLALAKIFGWLEENEETKTKFKIIGKSARFIITNDSYAAKLAIKDPNFDPQHRADSSWLSLIKKADQKMRKYIQSKERASKVDPVNEGAFNRAYDIKNSPMISQAESVLSSEDQSVPGSDEQQLAARALLANHYQDKQSYYEQAAGNYQAVLLNESRDRDAVRKDLGVLWPRYMRKKVELAIKLLSPAKIRACWEAVQRADTQLKNSTGGSDRYLTHVLEHLAEVLSDRNTQLFRLSLDSVTRQSQALLMLNTLRFVTESEMRLTSEERRRFSALSEVVMNKIRPALSELHDVETSSEHVPLSSDWLEEFPDQKHDALTRLHALDVEDGLVSVDHFVLANEFMAKLDLLTAVRDRIRSELQLDLAQHPLEFTTLDTDPVMDSPYYVSKIVTEYFISGAILGLSFYSSVLGKDALQTAVLPIIALQTGLYLTMWFRMDVMGRKKAFNEIFQEIGKNLSINSQSVYSLESKVDTPSQRGYRGEVLAKTFDTLPRLLSATFIGLVSGNIVFNHIIKDAGDNYVPAIDTGSLVDKISPTNEARSEDGDLTIRQRATTELWYEGERLIGFFAGSQVCYPVEPHAQLDCSDFDTFPNDTRTTDIEHVADLRQFRDLLETQYFNSEFVVQLKTGDASFFEIVDGTKPVKVIVQGGAENVTVEWHPFVGLEVSGDFERVAVISEVLPNPHQITDEWFNISGGFLGSITSEDVSNNPELSALQPLKSWVGRELENQQSRTRTMPQAEIAQAMLLPASERGWLTNREIIQHMTEWFHEQGYEYGLTPFDMQGAARHADRLVGILDEDEWDCEMISYMNMMVARWAQSEQFLGMSIYNRLGYSLPGGDLPAWVGNLGHMVSVYQEVDGNWYSYPFTLPNLDTYEDVAEAVDAELAQAEQSYFDQAEVEEARPPVERLLRENKDAAIGLAGILLLGILKYRKSKWRKFNLPHVSLPRLRMPHFQFHPIDFSHLIPNFKIRFVVPEDDSPNDEQLRPDSVSETPAQNSVGSVPVEMQQAFVHAQHIREQSLALTEMTAPVLFRVSEVLFTLFDFQDHLPSGNDLDRVQLNWDEQASLLAENLVSILMDSEYMNADWLQRWGKNALTAKALKTGIRDHFIANPTASDVPVELMVNAMNKLSPNEVAKKIKGKERALVRALSIIHSRLSEEIAALEVQAELTAPASDLTFSQALQQTSGDLERQRVWFKQAQAIVGLYLETLG